MFGCSAACHSQMYKKPQKLKKISLFKHVFKLFFNWNSYLIKTLIFKLIKVVKIQSNWSQESHFKSKYFTIQQLFHITIMIINNTVIVDFLPLARTKNGAKEIDEQ